MGGRLNLLHLKYQHNMENDSQSYDLSPPEQSYKAPQWSVTRPTQPPAPPPPPPRTITEPVVIGVMLLDINATPITRPDRLRSRGLVLDNQSPNSAGGANQYTRLSASPGKVAHVLGGVARNVADCMSKLKAKPFMISAVGHDMAGNLLWGHWKSTGLALQGILRQQAIETAISCNIFDGKGVLSAAVASVESIETFLTPDWIGKFKGRIGSAPILMVDANLSSLCLEASCQMATQFGTPVWFDPASVAKSRRIASVVHYVSFVSANEDELIAMANALYDRDIFPPVRRDHSSTVESLFELLKPAIRVLLLKGVKVIVVTIGSHGVFLCSESKSALGGLDFKGKQPPSSSKQLCEAVDAEWLTGKFLGASRYNLFSDFFMIHFPALSASVVRVTGAGDCLVGGTIASLCAGLDVMQSVSVGIAAAKFAVEVETNVPAEHSLDRIAYDAMYVYSGMSVSQWNTTKNPSFIRPTKDVATSQPLPQNKSTNNPQLQNPSIADAPFRGSANNYQISPGHVPQIDKQMTVRGQQYQQPIGTIINERPESSVQQKKDSEEKPKYAEILTNNIRNEAKQEDKHEEGQVEEEEEDAPWLWKAVKSKKEKKRSAKEENQRTAADGKRKNKYIKY